VESDDAGFFLHSAMACSYAAFSTLAISFHFYTTQILYCNNNNYYYYYYNYYNYNTCLTAIFQENSAKPVPEYHNSGFYWS